jgi:hypothetical protein
MVLQDVTHCLENALCVVFIFLCHGYVFLSIMQCVGVAFLQPFLCGLVIESLEKVIEEYNGGDALTGNESEKCEAEPIECHLHGL